MQSRVQIDRWLFLTNSGSSVLTHVLNVTVVVWLHQHLLRRIEPEEYSILPVVIGVVALLPVFSAVLLGGLERYTVESYAAGDDTRVTQITSTALPLLLASAGIVMALALCLAWHAGAVLSIPPDRVSDARIIAMLSAAAAAVRLALAPVSQGLYVRQKFIALNLIKLAGHVLRLAILLVLLLGVSTRVIWVMVASASSETTVAIAQAVISRRLVPALRFRRGAFKWSVARELAAFGAWNALTQVAGLVRTTAHPLMLSHWATPMDVTCYAVGSMFLSEVQRMTLLVTVPLLPPLTAMHARADKVGLGRAYLRGNRYALWVVLLIVIPGIIYGHQLVTLYIGGRYLLAAAVMACLLATIPAGHCNVMLGPIAFATAQLRLTAPRGAITQLVNLCLAAYFVGVLKLGAMGPALAVLIAMGVVRPLLLWPVGWRIAELSPGRWLRETIWPGCIPGAAGALVWLGLLSAVAPQTWLTLAGCGLVGALCYALVLWRFCLQPHEREDLKRILHTLRSWSQARRDGQPS